MHNLYQTFKVLPNLIASLKITRTNNIQLSIAECLRFAIYSTSYFFFNTPEMTINKDQEKKIIVGLSIDWNIYLFLLVNLLNDYFFQELRLRLFIVIQ